MTTLTANVLACAATLPGRVKSDFLRENLQNNEVLFRPSLTTF